MASQTGSSSESVVGEKGVLAISRGSSIALLVVYAAYRELIANWGGISLIALNSALPTLDSRVHVYR